MTLCGMAILMIKIIMKEMLIPFIIFMDLNNHSITIKLMQNMYNIKH